MCLVVCVVRLKHHRPFTARRVQHGRRRKPKGVHLSAPFPALLKCNDQLALSFNLLLLELHMQVSGELEMVHPLKVATPRSSALLNGVEGLAPLSCNMATREELFCQSGTHFISNLVAKGGKGSRNFPVKAKSSRST